MWANIKAMKTHEAILLFSKDFLANPESFWLWSKGKACYQHWEVPCHLKFWNRTYYWIERKSLIRDLAGKDCVWLLSVDNSCFWEWSLALPSDHRNPPSGAGSHRESQRSIPSCHWLPYVDLRVPALPCATFEF